jgi:ketosteroid isomerase-like protein
MSNLERARDLASMAGQGKTMEAFEKYYHDDCLIREMPTGEVRKGKEAQRQAIQQWFGMVKELHGGGVGAITADEENNVTCSESWFDITFQDGNRTKMEEVAVQHWKEGQIIEEKFYYNMPGQ